MYAFIPFPCEAGIKSRKKIISLSKDNSLSVIDLEDLYCKCRLLGHTSHVYALHWRSHDELLAVECENGLYIWQYKMKHLERFVDADRAEDIIGEFTSTVRVSDYDLNFRSVSSKSTMQLMPIKSSSECKSRIII